MNVSKKTLDTQHQEHLAKITNAREEILQIEKTIADYSEKLSIFEQVKSTLSDEDFQKNMDMLDKKIELTKKLSMLKNNFDETSYYVDTSNILFKYYDLVENGPKNNNRDDVTIGFQGNSILRFFNQPNNASTNVTTTKQTTDTRGALLDKYMSVLDPDHHSVKKISVAPEQCPHCKSSNIVTMINEGYTFCSNCHTIENMIVDHDKPSYKDPPKEITYFCYRRANHLGEWLSQTQGKETTDIPEEVYDKILLELKKQRITNMANINHKQIKAILKSLKLQKLFEHIAHIMNRLNGQPMPNFSPELEEKIKSIFKNIQPFFFKHSPPKRKNFLSYSYVLHKIMQLLDKDEYLSYFQLLKSRDKLAGQDMIWKKICADCGYQYIPSI
jgi:hypothetical protein